MKIFIPTIGTELKLTQDWEFNLYKERRNYDLYEVISGKPVDRNSYRFNENYQSIKAILPKETVLVVSRIYIRQGNSDFDSITLKAHSSNPLIDKARFWAKLNDVNNIEADVGIFTPNMKVVKKSKKQPK